MPLSPFLADALHLAERQGWSRRAFMAALAGSALSPQGAAAQETELAPATKASELVFASWGGDEIKSLTQAFGKSYEAASGTSIVFDGTGPALDLQQLLKRFHTRRYIFRRSTTRPCTRCSWMISSISSVSTY